MTTVEEFVLPDEIRKRLGNLQHKAGNRQVSDSARLFIFARDDHTCVECGWHPSTETDHRRRKLTIDHILERCLGGTNDLSNLQTMCSKCNSRKSQDLSRVSNLLVDRVGMSRDEAWEFLRKYYDVDHYMWQLGA